jgi:hypothetical protein
MERVPGEATGPLMPAGGVAAAVTEPGLDGVLSDIDPSLS